MRTLVLILKGNYINQNKALGTDIKKTFSNRIIESLLGFYNCFPTIQCLIERMLDYSGLILALTLTLLSLSTTTLTVIISYLRSKDLAHFTPFDSMSIWMCYAMMCSYWTESLLRSLVAIYAPIDYPYADILSKLAYFATVNLFYCGENPNQYEFHWSSLSTKVFFAGFHCAVFRHLAIFQSTTVEQISDQTWEIGLRVSSLCLAGFVFWIDFVTGSKGGLFYLALVGKPVFSSNVNHGIAPSTGFFTLAIVTMAISAGN